MVSSLNDKYSYGIILYMKKMRLLIAIIAEILVCASFCVAGLAASYEPVAINPDSYKQGDGYYYYRPAIDMHSGSYRISIDYIADTDYVKYDVLSASADVDAFFMSSVTGQLSKNSENIILNINLKKRINDIELRFTTGGQQFQVTGITVQRTGTGFIIIALRLLLMFICADVLFIILFLKKFDLKNKYNIGLLILTFISCIPLFSYGIYAGHDTAFHLLRIEGIAEYIVEGQIPSFIHPVYGRGYGYATGIFYPQLFFYIPAIFRVAGMSIVNAMKIYAAVINILTVLISFFSFRKLFGDDYPAFAGTDRKSVV